VRSRESEQAARRFPEQLLALLLSGKICRTTSMSGP